MKITFCLMLTAANFIFLGVLNAKEKDLNQKCENNIFSACKELGDQEVDKGNVREASSYFKKSCDVKNLEGCHFWGIAEYKLEHSADALSIWKDACASQYPYSCLSLGAIEEKKGNIEEANGFYNKACNMKSATACEKLKSRILKPSAQTAADSSQNNTHELMKLLKIENTLKEFYSGFYKGLMAAYSEKKKVKPTEKEMEQLNAIVQKSMNIEEAIDIYVKVYEAKFSKSEIQDLLDFYKSPTGQKLTESQLDIMLDATKELSVWAEKMNTKIERELELLEVTKRASK